MMEVVQEWMLEQGQNWPHIIVGLIGCRTGRYIEFLKNINNLTSQVSVSWTAKPSQPQNKPPHKTHILIKVRSGVTLLKQWPIISLKTWSPTHFLHKVLDDCTGVPTKKHFGKLYFSGNLFKEQVAFVIMLCIFLVYIITAQLWAF